MAPFALYAAAHVAGTFGVSGFEFVVLTHVDQHRAFGHSPLSLLNISLTDAGLGVVHQS